MLNIFDLLPGITRTLVKLMVFMVVWSTDAAIIESLLNTSFVFFTLSVYKTSWSKGSNIGFSVVLLIPANTGNAILICFGNNFPASILVAISNWVSPVLERSFIFCSTVPNPAVRLFTETDTDPKSANIKSILPKAAQAPVSSISDNLNSLTQTSASTALVAFVFSIAIKIPLTSPKFGEPFTVYLCLPKFFPYKEPAPNVELLSLSILSAIKSLKLKFNSLSAGHTESATTLPFNSPLVTRSGMRIS